jgi:hypothetical protein
VSERKRKSNKYWVAGPMAAAFLVALGTGCKKTETPEGGSVAALDTSTVATDHGLDDIPGRDTSRTRQYLKELDRHWTVAFNTTIHCDSLDCPGHDEDTVHLRIYTHRKTFKIDPFGILGANAQNSPGHIALKIVNLDAFTYVPLGLDPNDSAYLWVGKTDTITQFSPAPHRERAVAIFRIGEDGTATGVRRVYFAIRCRLSVEPDSSSAHLIRIGTCEEPNAPLDTLYKENVPPHLARLVRPLGNQGIHDQGLWFACSGGCCQSTTFGPY